MPKFRVKREGWLAGVYRQTGDIIDANEAEVRAFLPPHDNRLEEVLPPIIKADEKGASVSDKKPAKV
ncbi:hypothetical protein [Pseudochelatococcus sp. G4_1912]|uniref:hypothetical protein n=1 Tax=Pseudochelatococcus sp. G4_1912 TaxID=3114288 RepID=UPI0039C71F26